MQKASYYTEQVKRYVDIFGFKKIKIIIFEEFIKEPKKIMSEIYEFLGINSDLPDSVGKVFNPSKQPRGKISESIIRNKLLRDASKKILPRKSGTFLKTIFSKDTPKPEIPIEGRKFLEELFREDVKKLEGILEWQLPWSL